MKLNKEGPCVHLFEHAGVVQGSGLFGSTSGHIPHGIEPPAFEQSQDTYPCSPVGVHTDMFDCAPLPLPLSLSFSSYCSFTFSFSCPGPVSVCVSLCLSISIYLSIDRSIYQSVDLIFSLALSPSLSLSLSLHLPPPMFASCTGRLKHNLNFTLLLSVFAEGQPGKRCPSLNGSLPWLWGRFVASPSRAAWPPGERRGGPRRTEATR